MVKGISRQVIVVQSPEPELFEQAIFILKDGQAGVTDEMLLKEAKHLINKAGGRKRKNYLYGPVWACGGAMATGFIWLLTLLF